MAANTPIRRITLDRFMVHCDMLEYFVPVSGRSQSPKRAPVAEDGPLEGRGGQDGVQPNNAGERPLVG
jgi:hypothetical protein